MVCLGWIKRPPKHIYWLSNFLKTKYDLKMKSARLVLMLKLESLKISVWAFSIINLDQWFIR